MLKIQVVSDLHIEYKSNFVPDPLTFIIPTSDILILAGDIGSFYKCAQLKEFLERLCIYFKIVIYIPGNHEYYYVNGYTKSSMEQLYNNFVKEASSIQNLHILNCSSVQIEDVCILGCTLWSKPQISIPPFIVRIQEMDTITYNNIHNNHLIYIKKMMKYCKRKSIKLLVVTHHCPTFSVITSKKRLNDKYISLYATNLDNLLKKENVHTWIAGHIHINFDLITEGGTHLVGNQLGKNKHIAKNYNKSKIIEI